MSIAELFGANLARCRRRTGLSQEETVVRASLHRTEVGLVERGERLPRIDTVVKLAGALGASLDELTEGIDWTLGETVRGRFIETEVPGLGIVHRRFGVERKGNA